MGNGNKLLKDTLMYGVANFGSGILTFLMLPLYTHYFTTAEYGFWDLVVTTSTLLAPFITFELVAAVHRWLLIEKDEEKQKSIITTGAFTILRNLVFFNVVAIIIIFIVQLPYGWEALVFINLSVASSFIQQCARGLGFNKLFASLGIIQTTITVALNLFFILVLELRLEAFFYASIIAFICVILFAWTRMRFSKYIASKSYSMESLSAFLKYAIPIIPGAASWWIITMSDRYFITAYLGMDANGIYAVANKIPAILLMMNTVFSLAWKDNAIISFDAADKNAYYSNVFRHFFRLMTTAVICLTLLAKPILALVIGASFYSAWKYIGILLLGTLFNACSLFWAAGYHGAKKTNVIFVTSIIGAFVNVLFNVIFIQFFGMYAVVISTFLAFLITWVLRVFSAKPYFNIKMNVRDLVVLFILIPVAIIIPFIFNEIGIGISICLAVLLFVGYNWELIKLLIQKSVFIFRQIGNGSR